MVNVCNDIFPLFRLEGPPIEAIYIERGHINDSYAVICGDPESSPAYVLQRINHKVFRDPGGLMENFARVTRHIRRRLEETSVKEIGRRVLFCLPAADGKDYAIDAEGRMWRASQFISRAQSYDTIGSVEQAWYCAEAFGRFQRMVRDLPGPRLNEVIPDFHDTPKRLKRLEEAAAKAPAGRLQDAAREIAFVRERTALASTVVDALADGRVPERITHNDTKINNVMLDDETGQGICVIDLDTVMPGSVLYDFGDMVRTATSPASEDEADLSQVTLRLPYFEALVEGYLSQARDFLNDLELKWLPLSGQLITLTIGVRFLTDFLAGDVYFKTDADRPLHNLERCRTQFRLIECIEESMPEMHAIVKRMA
jgi:Ser/Thr protein kinase RdoA (MazF antagonist)